PTPTDTRRPSSPPVLRSWQLAHEMVPSADSCGSWKRRSPSTTLRRSSGTASGTGEMGDSTLFVRAAGAGWLEAAAGAGADVARHPMTPATPSVAVHSRYIGSLLLTALSSAA